MFTPYVVIWDGRQSLHDVFVSPRDVLLWQTTDRSLETALHHEDVMHAIWRQKAAKRRARLKAAE